MGKRIGFEITNAVTPFGSMLIAVRTLRLRGEDGAGIERSRALRQSEHRSRSCWPGWIGLDAEHRQVLRDVVAEDGAEDAEVVADGHSPCG